MRLRIPPSSIRISPAWYLVLGLLPFVTFMMRFRGHMVLGWDSIPPVRPELLLRSALSAWDGRAYLGQTGVFSLTEAPLAIVSIALQHVFGTIGGDRDMLAALFVLSAFTMYYAAKEVYPQLPGVWFVAGWCYALCPLLFARFYVPIYTVALTYALTPLLVVCWLRLTRTNIPLARRLLALALCELAFVPCAKNFAFWIAAHVFAFGYCCVLTWIIRNGERRAAFRAIAWGCVIAALTNGFWLLPQLAFGFTSGSTLANQTVNRAYSEGARRDVAENSTLSYTFRLSSRAMTEAGDQYGPYWTYARALKFGPLSALYYGFIIVALAGLGAGRKDAKAVTLGAFLVGAIYVMKGTSPPFAGPLQVLDHVPLVGTIFRDGYDKLIPVAAFTLSLLIALAVNDIALLTRSSRTVRVGAVCVVLALAFPYWTGQMFMARANGPSLSTMPPEALFKFSRQIDGLSARLVFLPASENSLLLSTDWGFYGPNIYGSMTDAPFIAGPVSTLNVSDANTLITEMYQAISDNNAVRFMELAGILGARYAFVAHDVSNSYYGGSTAADADRFLRRVPGARNILTEGPYALWQLPVDASRPMALSRELVAGYNVPFESAVAVKRACGVGNYALVWSASGSCSIGIGGHRLGDRGQSFYVYDRVPALLAVHDGKLEGYVFKPRIRSISIPLPKNTEASLINHVIVRRSLVPVELPAGASTIVQTYAITHERKLDISSFTGAHLSAFRRNPSALIVQSPMNAWIYADLPYRRSQLSMITMRSHPTDIEYQLAVVDKDTQRPSAVELFTAANEESILFRPQPSHSYQLYIYVSPQRPDAALEITSISIASAHVVGVAQLRTTRLAAAPRADSSAIQVHHTAAPSVPTNGGFIAPVAANTALVLNTQYDPMWVAVLVHDRAGGFVFPPHVVADGFKNAWLLPPNVAGKVHVFYAMTGLWIGGIVVLGLTLLILVILAIRNRSDLVDVQS